MMSVIARAADCLKRFWPELVTLLLANVFLIAVLGFNPRPVGMDAWASKAAELAAFSLPRSNFYPIGPALLYLPFLALGLNAVCALFVYFNAGFIFYMRICRGVGDRLVGRIALFAILFNPYFYWVLKSSQDSVLQFFVLSAALSFLIERRLVAYSLAALLGSVVRSTDIFVFAGLAFFMYLRERRAVWLLFPVLYLFVAGFNQAQYGSAAPSLNGGYNIYLGQHPLYALAHPRFDIDQFFEHEGLSDPQALFGLARTPTNEVELDAKYRALGFSFMKENPVRVLYASAMKLENWLFNFEKVPNLSGEFYLAKNGASIEVSPMRNNLLMGDGAYIVYKILYNGLFAVAIFLVALAPGYVSANPQIPLLLPMFFVAPVILLTFPDTRFKIVYEVLAVPAILVFAREAGARLGGRLNERHV